MLVETDKSNPRHNIVSGKDIVASFNFNKSGPTNVNIDAKSTLAVREYVMNKMKGSIGIISPYKS